MRKLLILIGLAFGAMATSQAQIISTIYNFSGNADGGTPQAGLILSPDRTTLYGTTSGGGSGYGVVFSFQTNGAGFQTLYTFTGGNDGGIPAAPLILSPDGKTLFGTTQGDGAGGGTVFSIQTNGTGFQTLQSFALGRSVWIPSIALSPDGTTLYGAAYSDHFSGGQVFSMLTDGTGFQTLYTFTGDNYSSYWPWPNKVAGGGPTSLILSSDGRTIYGTTLYGLGGGGEIFSMSTDGTGYRTLSTCSPQAGLILSPDGRTIFGTTSSDIYSLHIDGTGFQILFAFNEYRYWRYPNSGLVLSPDGKNLYGTTTSGGDYDLGMSFSLLTDGTGFQTEGSFDYTENTANGGLVVSPDGTTLYGTTQYGGSNNAGILFSINLTEDPIVANPVFFPSILTNANFLHDLAGSSTFLLALSNQISTLPYNLGIGTKGDIASLTLQSTGLSNSLSHSIATVTAQSAAISNTLSTTLTSAILNLSNSLIGTINSQTAGVSNTLASSLAAQGNSFSNSLSNSIAAVSAQISALSIALNNSISAGNAQSTALSNALSSALSNLSVQTAPTNPAFISAIASQILTASNNNGIAVKQNQSLNFPEIPVQTITPKSSVMLNVTSSQNQTPIIYTSGNTAVATVSNNIVTIIGSGSTTITASQAGNSLYNPISASQPLVVNKASQTLKFPAIPVQTFKTFKTLTLNATSSAKLAPIDYTCSNSAIGIVSNNLLLLEGTGTTTVTASQSGNTYFAPATATQTLIVK